MSYQHPNGLIIFSSLPEFYELEADGRKPNTVRIMDRGAADRALHATDIAINCIGEKRGFDAPLTSVVHGGDILGKVLVIFSWDARRVQHSAYDPTLGESLSDSNQEGVRP